METISKWLMVVEYLFLQAHGLFAGTAVAKDELAAGG